MFYLLLSCEVSLDIVDMPVSVRGQSGESLTGDWSNGELTHKSQRQLTNTERKAKTGTATAGRAETEGLRSAPDLLERARRGSPVGTEICHLGYWGCCPQGRAIPSSLLHSHLRGPGRSSSVRCLAGAHHFEKVLREASSSWALLVAVCYQGWELEAGNGESCAL